MREWSEEMDEKNVNDENCFVNKRLISEWSEKQSVRVSSWEGGLYGFRVLLSYCKFLARIYSVV